MGGLFGQNTFIWPSEKTDNRWGSEASSLWWNQKIRRLRFQRRRELWLVSPLGYANGRDQREAYPINNDIQEWNRYDWWRARLILILLSSIAIDILLFIVHTVSLQDWDNYIYLFYNWCNVIKSFMNNKLKPKNGNKAADHKVELL